MADSVLVVGGYGFLGRHICAAFAARGVPVEAVSRRAAGGAFDLFDIAAFRSARWENLRRETTHVVIAVGSASPGQSLSRLAVHMDGVARLLAALNGAPALERVVLVSSLLVYGDARPGFRAEGLDFGQSHPTLYGLAKYRSEQLLQDAGLPARVVRPGWLMGHSTTGAVDRDQPVVDFVRLCLRLRLLPLNDGGDYPAWLAPVDAVAEDVVAAALDPGLPDVVLSADPASPSLARLADELLEPFGSAPLTVRVGDRVSRSSAVRRLLTRVGVDPEWAAFARPWTSIRAEQIEANRERLSPLVVNGVQPTAHHIRQLFVAPGDVGK